MASFVLRKIDPGFWSRVQAKAAAEGTIVKALILKASAQYVLLSVVIGLSATCAYHAPDAPTATANLRSDAAPYSLTLGSLNATTAGQTSIRARVQNAKGAPLATIAVAFSTTIGTLSASSSMTAEDGMAMTTLTAPVGTATIVATVGTLVARTIVVTSAAPELLPTPPPPSIPTPPAPPTTPPLTVTLFATPRQVGTASDFSLATTTITSATWSFGDGTAPVTTSDPFASHVYTAGATYTVSATVTDTLGRQATATTIVTIVTPPAPPTPATGLIVTLTCTIAAHGNPTACNVAASNNGAPLGSNKIAKVDWDWGDGIGQIVNNSPLGSHTYVQAGSYRIEANTTVNTPDSDQRKAVSTSVVIE